MTPVRRTAAWLAAFAFLAYAWTGGGRVVGSDEVTMLELARALLHGRVQVPVGATLTGRDGRAYTKNAAAEAVLALPLVAAAEAAAGAAGLDPARRVLAVRFGASFFNAAVTAVLLAALYLLARALAVGRGAALAAALLLGFTTPVWPYAKSFMAEPLQSLGLVLAVAGASLACVPAHPRASRLGALGAFLAISVKLSMLPLAVAAVAPVLAAPPRAWHWPAAGVVLALAGHAAYNVARFGTPLETGYGSQATAAAYTTPILVGLYGLLLSSGKGVAWFAPAIWIAPAGWRTMTRAAAGGWRQRLALDRPAGRAAWGIALAWLAGLLLYARFQHWAGDGSFGPRYLVPLLPLAFLAVAFGLARAPRALVVALAAAGFLVQVGGVSIYFGAQMREAGDYPYTLPLEHPRFMSDSHFNPAFSPIAGHWKMLVRNLGEHARGAAPRLGGGGPVDPRLGVPAGDQAVLLHALDYWWLYLGYAGLPRAPVALAAVALLALAVAAALRLRAAWRDEARAP